MLRQEIYKKSPIRILEQTTQGGLGRGNIGVVASRPGEGKTACLVHFAIDALLQEKRVLHITFSEQPDHIYAWYDQVFGELARVLKIVMASDIHDEIASRRMILNFNRQSQKLDLLRERAANLSSSLNFLPDLIIIDGLNLTRAGEQGLLALKTMAAEFKAELWLSHSESEAVHTPAALPGSEQPGPAPLSILIHLESSAGTVKLRLLRDHERPCVEETHISLDPKSLLLIEA